MFQILVVAVTVRNPQTVFDCSKSTTQVVEAIRDFASRNEGRLPMSLADIELLCPHDPMTGKPFLYEFSGDGKVRLSAADIAVAADIAGVEDQVNRNKIPIYEISIASSK